MGERRAQRGAVGARDQAVRPPRCRRRTRRRRRRVAPGTATARVPRRRARAAPPRANRAVHVRMPVNRASSAAVSTASARERNGPTARSCLGARTTEKRGKGLVGEHHPPPSVRKLRPPVVRRRVGGEQPQFPHARLEVVRALDVVDAGGQRHHLLHPGPRVGAVEVLADPPPQIDRGADVEHLVGGPAEQVHPGLLRDAGGEVALAPLGGCHVGQIRPQVGIGVHALVSDARDERVQHVDRGARIVERAVGRGGGGTEQLRQCGQPHAGRLLAGQHPAGQLDRAQHRRLRPGELTALGGGPQEPDVEAGVVRDEDGAAGELQERRQHRFDPSAHRRPWPS